MHKKIILISGKARAGKDTVGNILKQYLSANTEMHLFSRLLKEYSAADFDQLTKQINWALDEFNSDVQKVTCNSEESAKIFRSAKERLFNKLYTKDKNQWWDEKNLITRNILQLYGTEVIRKRLGFETYWVDKVIEEIRKSKAEWHIITDFRFRTEAARITEKLLGFNFKSLLGIADSYSLVTVNVVSSRKGVQNMTHLSEVDLKDMKFNKVIQNDGTIEELERKVSSFSGMLMTGAFID